MKLSAKTRTLLKKSETKKLRREGKVPAILYPIKEGIPNQPLIIDRAEFDAILRKMKQGQLGTILFYLKIEEEEKKVIVKDIHYEPTTYLVWHIDFKEVDDHSLVRIKVPIQCVGVAECVGIKLGGFLRRTIRHMEVECLPQNIPQEFLVDVSQLGIKQSKRFSDIVLPQGIKSLVRHDEVVVVISKRTT